jgi:hypothetical protein
MNGFQRRWNRAKQNEARRFWSKVDQSKGPEACWPWLAGLDKDGYGRFQTGRHGAQTYHRAHRYAYALEYGEKPHVVRHMCDYPACCNPLHLLGGTQKDNIQDCVRRGRFARGERNGRAVLSAVQVAEIRRLYRRGKNSRESAQRFHVRQGTISQIGSGKWRRFG